MMRTTIDFPEPVLDKLRAIARDRGASLSSVVTDLVERGFAPRPTARIVVGASGFPALESNGRTITTEDVRRLEDDW